MKNLYSEIYVAESEKSTPGNGLAKAVQECANDILNGFVNPLPQSEYPFIIEAMKLIIKVMANHVPQEIRDNLAHFMNRAVEARVTSIVRGEKKDE